MSVLLNVLSVRQSTVIGSVIGALGLAACCFAPNVMYVVVVFSLALGLSMGMASATGFILLNVYFNRKLPMAIAIANSGGSIGSVVIPIVTRMLMDEYFLSGAFLIISGIYAQNIICGFLFTPPTDYQPKNIRRYEEDDTKGDVTELNEKLLTQPAAESKRRRTVSESAAETLAKDRKNGPDPLASSLQHLNLHSKDTDGHKSISGSSLNGSTQLVVVSCSHGSQGVLCQSLHANCSLSSLHVAADTDAFSHKISSSAVDKPHTGDSHHTVPPIQELSEGDVDKNGIHKKPPSASQADGNLQTYCCGKGCSEISCSFQLCDFRDPVSWLLHTYHFLGSIAAGISSSFIPLLAEEKGLTPTEGALLMTIFGALDIFSRVIPGLLTQTRVMKPPTIVAISLITLGLLFQMTYFTNTMATLTAMAVIFGMVSGVIFSLIPQMLVYVLGLEMFRQAFGATQLFMGIGAILGYPALGYIKDATGTYVAAFHLLGACALVAVVLLLLIPRVHHYCETKRTKKETVLEIS